MTIAVVATLALALSLGFLLGLRFTSIRAYYDGNGGSSSTSSASDYDTHALGLSRLTRHDAAAKAAKLDALYAGTELLSQNDRPPQYTPSLQRSRGCTGWRRVRGWSRAGG